MLDTYIQQALAVVAAYQQPTGAYPASPNFDAYKYTWFRDGSFTADAMSRNGDIRSAEHFFSWGARIILERKEKIQRGEKLNARYTYDGQEVEGDWGEFQLDGYGIFLWALKNHIIRHDRFKDSYKDAVDLIQEYLLKHWQTPCFDWWEERIGMHSATLACIYAGLKAYENPAADEVRVAIHLSDERTDASLIVCGLFDAVDFDTFAPTLAKIEGELVSTDSGVYRYKGDEYYGGGEWPVLSGLLGMYYLKIGEVNKLKKHLIWSLRQAGENNWIPEQTQANLLAPKKYDEWVEKSGKPANPLLWSHAMTASLALQLEELGKQPAA